MSIYLGSSKISKVYIGGNEASAVYQGTTKIRPDIVPVTGVSLNTSSISFTAKNQTNQLTATVLPNNATNKNVIWSSSNTSVATVSSSGLVTCKGNGNCTITVTTQDGGYTATCGVTAVVPRIFTISWTEKSYMSSGWTYSDDAAGLTAGSTVFDEFFGYSAVKLNENGVETASVTQNQSGGAGKLDISKLGTLTSGDNVMIKFPRLGIKMSKSGSNVTLSITDNPDAEADGYQYYAHCTGTLSNPGTPKNAFYLGAYKASNNGSNVLKSWSGKSPEVSQAQFTFCSRASANGSGYNIIGYYQRQFVNALYMMKYGNPDCQSVIGKGYTAGSAKANTGGTVSQTLATYGTTSATQQVKLFGLEDWWGNVHEWIGGVYTGGSKNLCVKLSGYSGDVSGGENTGSTIQTTSGNDLSSIVGNNKVLFGPSATVNNSNYNTYYCDFVGVSDSRLAIAGGCWADGSSAGAFYLYVSFDTYYPNATIGSRLMFL